MKFRKDFVTNSSSSSYICDICGRNESGWDIGLSDCEMMECINGHIFCIREALEKPTKEEMIKIILEGAYKVNNEKLSQYSEEDLFDEFMSEEGYYEVHECVCPICNFIEYNQNDLKAFLKKKYNIDENEVFEEVKKFNKRRKKLYDEEYITYVCKKFNLSPTEIVSNWKTEFVTYKKFSEFLRAK